MNENSMYTAIRFKESQTKNFRENHPEAKDYFIEGKTIPEILEKTNYLEEQNLSPGQNMNEIVRMALGGYKDQNGEFIPGLIDDQDQFKSLMKQHYKKVLPTEQRKINATLAYEKKKEENGEIPYTDEHRLFVWYATRDKKIQNNKIVNRKKLIEIINENPINQKSLNETELNSIISKLYKPTTIFEDMRKNILKYKQQQQRQQQQRLEQKQEKKRSDNENNYLFVWLATKQKDMYTQSGFNRKKAIEISEEKITTIYQLTMIK